MNVTRAQSRSHPPQVSGSVESWVPLIRMYRLSGCCILLSWAWAFNFFVFNTCRVNYVLILEVS